MRIKPEHVEHMRAAMAPILANYSKPADHSDKRYRWEVAYAAGLMPFITDTLYTYANDTHIDTALRSIAASVQSSTGRQTARS
jgi:hypothetical protein